MINVLAQGHNTVTPVRLEPAAPQSRVKHSTIEPLCCQIMGQCVPTFDHYIVIWLEICMVIGWLSLNRCAGIMTNIVKYIDHLAHWRVSDLAFLGYFLL